MALSLTPAPGPGPGPVAGSGLHCNWPGCVGVKADRVWWESSSADDPPGPWNRTTDGRHWCAGHTRREITALMEVEVERGVPLLPLLAQHWSAGP